MARLSPLSLEELYVQEDMRKRARQGLLNTAVQQTQATPQMPVNIPQQPVMAEYQAPIPTGVGISPQQTTTAPQEDLSSLFANLPSRADSYTTDQINQVTDALNANTINVDQAGKFYGMDPEAVQANLDSINAARLAAAKPDPASTTTIVGQQDPAITPSLADQAANTGPFVAGSALSAGQDTTATTGLIANAGQKSNSQNFIDLITGGKNNNATGVEAPAGLIADQTYYKGISNPLEAAGVRTEDKTQINALYQSILGREGDEAGLDKYLNDMNSGASIDAVRSGILKTDEYKGIATTAIEGMYQSILGRAADPQSLNFYVSAAQEGTSLEDIRKQIELSAESQVKKAQDASGSTVAPTPTAVDPGSQATTTAAVEDAQTYTATTADASDDATAQETATPTRTVSEEETVQYQLDQILDPNSELMQSARTRGLQYANQRGLLNSSIAAQAAQQAMIDAAIPIAQQDARTYAEAAGQITDFEGRGALQDAQLGTNVSMFNVGEENVTNRFNAESQNRAGEFNANAANVAIQNFLQREAARDLQDDSQLFTAEQNEADRNLRTYLQERQFNFQSAENVLDRDFQNALQENDRSFRSAEAALDRELSQLQADQRITFEKWSQENNQTWNAAQNELQREFDKYRTDAQTASTVLYSTMENIANIQADPNLTRSQKQNAIANVMNLANSMPSLLARIDAGMTQQRETTNPDNYDVNGTWIGDGLPTWVKPPAEDADVAQSPEVITNPDTGQTFTAPTGGYTLNVLNANPPDDSDTQTGSLQTPDVNPDELTVVSDADGIFTDGSLFYRLDANGEYIEVDDPSADGR